MAGDEDEEYMKNADNHAIYLVNTICNYDPDSILFLNSAPGTAFIRSESGVFVLDEEWEDPNQ